MLAACQVDEVDLGVTRQADTLIGQWSLFAGGVTYSDGLMGNIYSPSVIWDDQAGNYKMWYGGWHTAGQTNDKIYYRTSSDGAVWSSTPTTVLTPAQLNARPGSGCSASCDITNPANTSCPSACANCLFHVNDPAVTRHLNAVNGLWQYTMFYTPYLCGSTAGSGHDEIWSSVSQDGLTWTTPVPLLTGPSSYHTPTSIIVDQPSAFWKVFYSSTADCQHLRVAYVDGTRNAVSQGTLVYTESGGACCNNPEVRRIGVNGSANWYVFYNTIYAPPGEPSREDIWRVSGAGGEGCIASDSCWTGASRELFLDNGPSSNTYGTITPGVLSWPNSPNYDFFFAREQKPCQAFGTCSARNQDIQRWRWQL